MAIGLFYLISQNNSSDAGDGLTQEVAEGGSSGMYLRKGRGSMGGGRGSGRVDWRRWGQACAGGSVGGLARQALKPWLGIWGGVGFGGGRERNRGKRCRGNLVFLPSAFPPSLVKQAQTHDELTVTIVVEEGKKKFER